MIVYIVPSPPNALDRKKRASGWRMVPLDRESKRNIKKMADFLREYGAARILCSDLDQEAGNILGQELRLPVKKEWNLRRFNVGRHHAAPEEKISEILTGLEDKWKGNPDISIRGGDSWTSYQKRFIANFQKLLAEDGTSILVTDCRTVQVIRDGYTPHSLIPNGNPVKLTSIYRVEQP